MTIIFGAVVGFSLGLTGGGGAIFAVPLLVYGLNVEPREAVGISLVTVGITALVGFLQRARLGLVELKTGVLFAAAGMLTAPLGAWLAAQMPESLLLLLFAALMLVIAVRMWRKATCAYESLIVCTTTNESGPTCRRDPEGKLHLNSRCALLLGLVGMAAGVLTGLFGVGGGFIIVPALVTFSGMGIQRAIGTSLLVIALVSVSGVTSLALLGRPVPLELVGLFAGGEVAGLLIGSSLARALSGPALQKTFAVAIVLVGLFIILRNIG